MISLFESGQGLVLGGRALVADGRGRQRRSSDGADQSAAAVGAAAAACRAARTDARAAMAVGVGRQAQVRPGWIRRSCRPLVFHVCNRIFE